MLFRDDRFILFMGYSSSVYVFLQQVLLEIHVHLLHLVVSLLLVLQSPDGLFLLLNVFV